MSLVLRVDIVANCNVSMLQLVIVINGRVMDTVDSTWEESHLIYPFAVRFPTFHYVRRVDHVLTLVHAAHRVDKGLFLLAIVNALVWVFSVFRIINFFQSSLFEQLSSLLFV